MEKYVRNGKTAKVTAVFYFHTCQGNIVVSYNRKVLATEYLEMNDYNNFCKFVNKYFA